MRLDAQFRRFPRLAPVVGPNEWFDYAIQLPRCSPIKTTGLQVIGEVRRQGVLFATVLRAQSSELSSIQGQPTQAPASSRRS